MNIRKSTEEMILAISILSTSALPWLVKSLTSIDPYMDGSDEFFSVLLKLVQGSILLNRRSIDNNTGERLCELGTAVCIKLASYPRPNSDTVNIDHCTGVLCGCLKLLVALIEIDNDDNVGSSGFLVEGSRHILHSLNISPWSSSGEFHSNNNSQWNGSLNAIDKAVIDLMGSIFDGFISSARSSGLPPICCDKESR